MPARQPARTRPSATLRGEAPRQRMSARAPTIRTTEKAAEKDERGAARLRAPLGGLEALALHQRRHPRPLVLRGRGRLLRRRMVPAEHCLRVERRLSPCGLAPGGRRGGAARDGTPTRRAPRCPRPRAASPWRRPRAAPTAAARAPSRSGSCRSSADSGVSPARPRPRLPAPGRGGFSRAAGVPSACRRTGMRARLVLDPLPDLERHRRLALLEQMPDQPDGAGHHAEAADDLVGEAELAADRADRAGRVDRQRAAETRSASAPIRFISPT